MKAAHRPTPKSNFAPVGPILGISSSLAVLLVLAILPMDSASQGYVAVLLVGMMSGAVALAYREDYLIARLTFCSLGVLISIRYLFWRASHTLDGGEMVGLIFAYLLFAAEIYYFIILLIGLFVNVCHRKRPTLSVSDLLPIDLPSVDIMVPSYNEDVGLLEVTLRAAKLTKYAGQKEVYLLDDGGTEQKINDNDPAKAWEALTRRRELQKLCARLGCKYITREKNVSAKAGNINHALLKTNGDLIAILDADHVPTIDFLDRTVPWMIRDPDTFLVQTPHFMMNSDPIDRNLLRSFQNMPAENDMFYKTILRGLDFWSTSFFCGSAAVLRREKLVEVGGLSGETITEDAEAALEMHSRGWNSVYVKDTVVAGLAPESFSGFIVQRMRWAQGMAQILLLKRPFSKPNLQWYQRIGYMSAILFWLFPFFRIIFLCAPLPYLIFGLEVYRASLIEILTYAFPHLFATFVIGHALYGRTRWVLVSEIYETVQSVFLVRALLKVIRRPRAPSFIVTPKGETLETSSISPMANSFYILLIFVLMGFVGGVWHLVDDPMTRGTTSMIIFWNALNLILILAALAAVLERPQLRTAPRIPTKEVGFVLSRCGKCEKVQIRDVSANGVGFVLDDTKAALAIDDRVDLFVFSHALKRVISLPIIVVSRTGLRAGAAFQKIDSATADLVVAYVFGDSGRWQYFEEMRQRPLPIRNALWMFLTALAEPLKNHSSLALKSIMAAVARRVAAALK